ncbi:MAG: hypothetical protein GWN58_16470 [Anaerolineae bacterium]|nr:hypothetical protein [Anaerolineae bacterium]
MATPFSRSTRSLEADGFQGGLLALLLSGVLLVAWLVWFFGAQITIYEVSQTAHLVQPDRLVAEFPVSALGRIQPTQPARLRLDSFPWTQHGTVVATVRNVSRQAGENNQIRVELEVHPNTAAMSLQRGLSGVVEIEVDRVSPALLVLRTAGLRLATVTDRINEGAGQ